jgi:hypothetical protein
MIHLRLRPDVGLHVVYADDTPFGSPISPKLSQSLASLFAPIEDAARAHGVPHVVERAVPLLEDLRARLQVAGILTAAGRSRIASEILYPDPRQARLAALAFSSASGGIEHLYVDCAAGVLPGLHDVVAALQGDVTALATRSGELARIHRALLDELGRRGLLLPCESGAPGDFPREPETWQSADATFVGHNTVVIRSATTRVVVDPWLPPTAGRYPRGYQPVARAEFGRIDAILLTHSHPDHFVPETLLQFDRSVPVIVPRIERESLLAVDMVFRLRELGFADVRPVGWWETLRVGDIEVVALPFYGEQPTTGEQLCPEVRNAGNTYLVRTPSFACALIADSGRDRAGDVRDVALNAFRRWGPIDVLFAGYRGWSLYPIQYAASSVRAYLLLVPPELDMVRQSIMNTASEAVDTAEAWHAGYLVPYADGGAPWFWEGGLGPDLSTDGGRTPTEWPYFDPLPEACLEALRVRSAPTQDTLVGSPVRPLLLRPGQSIRMRDGIAQVLEVDGHVWPWGDRTPLPSRATAPGFASATLGAPLPTGAVDPDAQRNPAGARG